MEGSKHLDTLCEWPDEVKPMLNDLAPMLVGTLTPCLGKSISYSRVDEPPLLKSYLKSDYPSK